MSELSMPKAHRALFGTDYDGNECWFCHAKRGGCGGIIATVEPAPSGDDEVLYLPNRYSKFSNGAWGEQTRGAFRSPQAKEMKDAARQWRREARETENPYRQMELEILADAVGKSPYSAAPLASDFFTPWLTRDDFDAGPQVVICPSCKMRNLVPSFRGLVEVHRGAVIK